MRGGLAARLQELSLAVWLMVRRHGQQQLVIRRPARFRRLVGIQPWGVQLMSNVFGRSLALSVGFLLVLSSTAVPQQFIIVITRIVPPLQIKILL